VAEDIPRAWFDAFTSIDERLDRSNELLAQSVSTLAAMLDQLGGVPPVQIPSEGRSIALYAEVEPLELALVTEDVPIGGKIKQLAISWPDGCDFNVLVAFGHSDQWVVPGITDHYERNNDTTVIYPLNEPVYEGEECWLRIGNGDDTNPHAISATVVIVK